MISTAELVTKVRRLVNEADSDVSISLITDDTRSLDTSIKELLPQAVSLVQKNSRNGFVNVKTLSPWSCNMVIMSGSKGNFTLPSDFVSLVSLKLTNWKVPLKEIVPQFSCEAMLQNNKATAATPFRPVCVETVSSDGTRLVEVSPATAVSSVEHFVYEAEYSISDGLNTSNSRMTDAVIYACAALLYNMFERYDASKSFMSYAMALCGSGEK